MAITLEEAKKNVQDDLQMGVIDEFQKQNFILEHIPFDDAVSPTGGGATPSYSYVRLKTQPKAEFRAINTEYTSSEVTKEPHTVTITLSGKRNIGDTGNDFVAGKTFTNGHDSEAYFEWIMPDGTSISWLNAVIDVKNNSGGDATNVGALEFDVISNGKPTVTPAL